jgi:glycosyltransferase involved in cell wall biosynthesis
MLDLTLGIPLYNSAHTLEGTLRSVASQLVRPREIVIIDDSSTDQSVELARRLIASYGLHQAKLICNSKNLGIAGTYNKIVELSQSEWTQILDADDVLQEKYYATLQRDLDLTDALAVVTGMTINIRGLNLLAQIASRVLTNNPPRFVPLLGTLATRSGVIYRTSALKTTPFPDPQFDGSDIIHLLRLRLEGRCFYFPKTKVNYRVHASAATAKASTEEFRRALHEFPTLRPFFLADMWCRKSLFGFARRAAR